MGSILDEELYCIGCNIIIGVGEAEPDVDGEGIMDLFSLFFGFMLGWLCRLIVHAYYNYRLRTMIDETRDIIRGIK
jgi:hypothetical protein